MELGAEAVNGIARYFFSFFWYFGFLLIGFEMNH